ncbi:uncharacterized protein TNCV_4332001 [Trichonephila clavipes]|nr:uncharacterized protein TNCV_4332001 [Trichonephila clavipes]
MQNVCNNITYYYDGTRVDFYTKLLFSFRLATSCVARDKPWSTLCKKSHGIPSSRAAAVAKFRLLTGHDCLCAHLFRFNLVTSPICVLCDTGQDMTTAHLDECSALKDLNCIVKSSALILLQQIADQGPKVSREECLSFSSSAYKQAVTPNCLGGPPVDRDRRNAHPGLKVIPVNRKKTRGVRAEGEKEIEPAPVSNMSAVYQNDRGKHFAGVVLWAYGS